MTDEEKELKEQAKAVLKQMKGKKKLLALHFHPDAIRGLIAKIVGHIAFLIYANLAESLLKRFIQPI